MFEQRMDGGGTEDSQKKMYRVVMECVLQEWQRGPPASWCVDLCSAALAIRSILWKEVYAEIESTTNAKPKYGLKTDRKRGLLQLISKERIWNLASISSPEDPAMLPMIEVAGNLTLPPWASEASITAGIMKAKVHALFSS